MNDRLWAMKVVVEKVREFIFVIVKKILRLENFTFHKQQAALRCVSVRNTFVAVKYNIRRSLNYITRYFSTIESCQRADDRNVSFSLDFGNWTLTNPSDAKFGVSLSRRRHTAVSFEPTHYNNINNNNNNNNNNCLFTNPQASENEIKEVIPIQFIF